MVRSSGSFGFRVREREERWGPRLVLRSRGCVCVREGGGGRDSVPPALLRISKSEREEVDGVAGSESWSLM